jgi:hypothetical protein
MHTKIDLKRALVLGAFFKNRYGLEVSFKYKITRRGSK